MQTTVAQHLCESALGQSRWIDANFIQLGSAGGLPLDNATLCAGRVRRLLIVPGRL
jgi:hypothetical protein